MEAGRKVIIRTVTHYYTGRVAMTIGQWIALDDAAWIADTGRWSKALTTGELKEVEPYPGRVWINRDTIVDWTEWNHDLPREVK